MDGENGGQLQRVRAALLFAVRRAPENLVSALASCALDLGMDLPGVRRDLVLPVVALPTGLVQPDLDPQGDEELRVGVS